MNVSITYQHMYCICTCSWSFILTPCVAEARGHKQNYQTIWHCATLYTSSLLQCTSSLYCFWLSWLAHVVAASILHNMYENVTNAWPIMKKKKIQGKLFSNDWACLTILKHENDLNENLEGKNNVSYSIHVHVLCTSWKHAVIEITSKLKAVHVMLTCVQLYRLHHQTSSAIL